MGACVRGRSAGKALSACGEGEKVVWSTLFLERKTSVCVSHKMCWSGTEEREQTLVIQPSNIIHWAKKLEATNSVDTSREKGW